MGQRVYDLPPPKWGITMTPKRIEQHKRDIDKLTQLQMACLWRNAPSGHPYFDKRIPEVSEYFASKFEGFTPAISKALS